MFNFFSKSVEKRDEIIRECVEMHKRILFIKFKQLSHTDSYGNYNPEPFDNELQYFERSTLAPMLEKEGFKLDKGAKLKLIQTFYNELDKHLAENPNSEIEVVTGEDYERLVGFKLEEAGWSVEYTPRTGDQGVDIIAEKNGERIAIQCKYHSNALSNSAIQEVYSGAKFYNADKAYVISSSLLTKSALQLAAVLGVLYLHHDEIGIEFP